MYPMLIFIIPTLTMNSNCIYHVRDTMCHMLNKYSLLSPENTSKKLKWHLGPAGAIICMAITREREREEINMDSIE